MQHKLRRVYDLIGHYADSLVNQSEVQPILRNVHQYHLTLYCWLYFLLALLCQLLLVLVLLLPPRLLYYRPDRLELIDQFQYLRGKPNLKRRLTQLEMCCLFVCVENHLYRVQASHHWE